MRYHEAVSIEEMSSASTYESTTPRHREQPVTNTQRRVLGLAWPVIGENLLETLLHIVDTVLVAGLGAVAIAGVGTALQVMFFLLAALSALSVGSSVLVAHAIGAGNLRRASDLARQSLLWSVVLSVPIALGGVLLSNPVIALFGVEPEVARVAVDYLRVSMGTVVVLVALLIGGGVLRGAGDSRTPMLVTGIANVLNVGLAYGLIYGHLGLPKMGAVGSAWGTFLARALALVLLVIALWRGRKGVSIRRGVSWRPQVGVARQVLRLGVPAAFEQALISAAFFVLTIVVAQLGTQALAAYRISFTALTFSFLPGLGFGIAATALVGQSVGARKYKEAAASARVATVWAVGWMGLIGLLLALLATPIMHLFSSDPEVIRMGAQGLWVVALAQPFWAVVFVQSGAIRGMGDTRFPLAVNSIGVWLSALLSLALIETMGGELIYVWVSFLAIPPLRAAILGRYLRRSILHTSARR